MSGFTKTTAANLRSIITYLRNGGSLPELVDIPAEILTSTADWLTQAVGTTYHGSRTTTISYGDSDLEGRQINMVLVVLGVVQARFEQIVESAAPLMPVDAQAVLAFMAPEDGSIRLGATRTDDEVVDGIIDKLRQIVGAAKLNVHLNDLFEEDETVMRAELVEVLGNIIKTWSGFHFVLSGAR